MVRERAPKPENVPACPANQAGLFDRSKVPDPTPETTPGNKVNTRHEMVVTKEVLGEEITQDFLDSIPPTDERMRAATRAPLCVVCKEPGPDTHSALCGGPAHTQCAKQVKDNARKNKNYAEVANKNAGVGKVWESKAYRRVTELEEGDATVTVDQTLECKAGWVDPEVVQPGKKVYYASADEGCGDGGITILISSNKVDLTNIMFRAALESVGFKEQK